MVPGLIACAAAVAVATAVGLAWRARNGRIRPGGPAGAAAGQAGVAGPSAATPLQITPDDLGTPLGPRATLVQFSTAFCAPCRATRQILADVTRAAAGVTHVEIDAESRLDLVRKLDVRRTPTVFVVGADGRVAGRASGQPRKADVIAVLEAIGQ